MSAKFNLDRQIASAPEAMRKILAVEVPELDHGRPIILTGIGTSLHAARVAAGWISMLTDGKTRAQVLDAHDVGTWVPLQPDDQVIVISHRGTKIFPTAALARARAAGASRLIKEAAARVTLNSSPVHGFFSPAILKPRHHFFMPE